MNTLHLINRDCITSAHGSVVSFHFSGTMWGTVYDSGALIEYLHELVGTASLLISLSATDEDECRWIAADHAPLCIPDTDRAPPNTSSCRTVTVCILIPGGELLTSAVGFWLCIAGSFGSGTL